MSFTNKAYKVARASATGRSVSRGHGVRRAKNIAVGRTAARAGLWKRLWK